MTRLREGVKNAILSIETKVPNSLVLATQLAVVSVELDCGKSSTRAQTVGANLIGPFIELGLHTGFQTIESFLSVFGHLNGPLYRHDQCTSKKVKVETSRRRNEVSLWFCQLKFCLSSLQVRYQPPLQMDTGFTIENVLDIAMLDLPKSNNADETKTDVEGAEGVASKEIDDSSLD